MAEDKFMLNKVREIKNGVKNWTPYFLPCSIYSYTLL